MRKLGTGSKGTLANTKHRVRINAHANSKASNTATKDVQDSPTTLGRRHPEKEKEKGNM